MSEFQQTFKLQHRVSGWKTEYYATIQYFSH